MRKLNKLSATKLGSLNEPGRYGDGGGLYIQVSKWRSKDGAEQINKSWIFRYQLNGRSRDMGLGNLNSVSLARARTEALKAREMLSGVAPVDPLEARNAAKQHLLAEAAKQITFKACAEKYIAAHRAGWRNEKHADQWASTLETYAYPAIGGLSVAAIDTSHVIKILEPIWNTKAPTATRVRGRMEAVLDWAIARKFRNGENPARWRGHMDKLLPRAEKISKVQHHPALPYPEAPGFMAALRAQQSISARALELTILTAARTNETIKAEWGEFDLKLKVWTIPATRTKAGREHRVPLADRAVAILKALPREKDSEWVFPGGRARRPLSNMAMLELLRGMKGNDLTVHGFRSTFRDWAGEETNYPREIAEAALGHVLGDKVEAAYRRGDALEKRRRLMDAWARYCGSAQQKGRAENVTPIRRAR